MKGLFFNKIIKLLKILSTLGILVVIFFYIFLKVNWKFTIYEKNISALVEEIKQADELPEEFYQMYNVHYEKSLDKGLLYHEFHSIYQVKSHNALCLFVSRIYLLDTNNKTLKRNFLTAYSLALELQNRTTNRELLNWLVTKYDFLNKAVGIKKASKIYFNKDIIELDEHEMAILVVIMENSSLYNLLRREKLVKDKANILLKKYHSKKH